MRRKYVPLRPVTNLRQEIRTLGEYVEQINKRWDALEKRLEKIERNQEFLARPYYDERFKEVK